MVISPTESILKYSGIAAGIRNWSAALWLLLVPAIGMSITPPDGHWQLEISGHQRFVFGDRVLGGGLNIPWRIEINFLIRDGQFVSGQGTSSIIDPVRPYSVPAGWIDCEPVAGTYLDRHLRLQETPWIRYPRFGVAGLVERETIDLRPQLRSLGNYLAVTYNCSTDRAAAGNWFSFAARARQEASRRQDAVTRILGDQQEAEIKEVKLLPPDLRLHLPLIDGWFMEQGGAEMDRRVHYRLLKISR